MSVAIIGAHGYVGRSMLKIFPEAYAYDINVGSKNEVNKRELAIICVPTPCVDKGECDTSIVEEIISWLNTKHILIKSTVAPGTTDYLSRRYQKEIHFSPEYVGESKYQITPWRYMSKDDPLTHDFIIIGGPSPEGIAQFFLEKLGPEKVYFFCTAKEAEIIKYMENCWGATKIIFCYEFFQLCERLGASYMKVREGWLLDNRIERMHTAVFDRKGFSGRCLPKDVAAILFLADFIGVDMKVLKAVLEKNIQLSENA